MPKPKDLTGLKFGKLQVIENTGRTKNGKLLWKCKCECGRIKDIISGNLVQKLTKSCGVCVKTPDLIGKRFGDITVVKRLGYRKASDNKNKTYWLCVDDKGNKAEYCTGDLRAYRKLKIHKEMTIKEAAIRRLLTTYKSSATDRDYEFNLKYEDFERLLFQNCFYCGSEPSNTFRAKRSKKDTIKYNGIDRKNNSLGYTKENCVTCCRTCNRGKYFLTYEEWMNYIKRLVNFNKEREK